MGSISYTLVTMFVDNHDTTTLNMLCNKCMQLSPIVACKMLNNCSFQCLACNNVNILVNEIVPIAISNNGNFALTHVEHVHMFTPHIHHIYYDKLLNGNGDVQKKWNIMMDDCSYTMHTHSLLRLLCV
jgi:hypothetical protein